MWTKYLYDCKTNKTPLFVPYVNFLLHYIVYTRVWFIPKIRTTDYKGVTSISSKRYAVRAKVTHVYHVKILYYYYTVYYIENILSSGTFYLNLITVSSSSSPTLQYPTSKEVASQVAKVHTVLTQFRQEKQPNVMNRPDLQLVTSWLERSFKIQIKEQVDKEDYGATQLEEEPQCIMIIYKDIISRRKLS